jgi:hypothetical protein
VQHCSLRLLLPARHCLLQVQVQRGLLIQLLLLVQHFVCCCGWCSSLAAAGWCSLFVALVAADAAFFAAAGAVLFAAGADAASVA